MSFRQEIVSAVKTNISAQFVRVYSTCTCIYKIIWLSKSQKRRIPLDIYLQGYRRKSTAKSLWCTYSIYTRMRKTTNYMICRFYFQV